MSSIPTNALRRSARIALVPATHAGRIALGGAKKIGGQNAEAVTKEIQMRTAQQLFSVLGGLKGGATKLGQVLSVMEVGMPEELVGPYREALAKLQDASIPVLSKKEVQDILAKAKKEGELTQVATLEDLPVAAASIGQVHRGRLQNGQEVAIKIQYPGAAEALRTDLRTLEVLAPLLKIVAPGLDAKALLKGLREQVEEELDYKKEEKAQRAFYKGWRDVKEIRVPEPFESTKKILVTEWVESTPLLSKRAQAEKDLLGEQITRFMLESPKRTGYMHGDPHPGNFRVDAKNNLLVLDFGAAFKADSFDVVFGTVMRLTEEGDGKGIIKAWEEAGILPKNSNVEANTALEYNKAGIEPLMSEKFRFTRKWVRSQTSEILDTKSASYKLSRLMNFPPRLLVPHRVLVGVIGLLTLLEAEVPYCEIVAENLPGFIEGVDVTSIKLGSLEMGSLELGQDSVTKAKKHLQKQIASNKNLEQ